MQVGDDQEALLFPEQRAGEIGDEGYAGDAIAVSLDGIDGSRELSKPTSLSRRLPDEFLGGFRQQLVGCFAIN